MTLAYSSGERILPGDLVLYHGEPGEIEFVVDPASEDPQAPQHDWFASEFGACVMIAEPRVFGRVLVQNPETNEDLAFISRAAAL